MPERKPPRLRLAKAKTSSRPPEYKAMASKGLSLAKRITIKQYFLLVELGCDGDAVKGWTCNRAQKEITRRLQK